MITTLNLTESGVEKFNTWFQSNAREGVRIEVVVGEVCDTMVDRVAAGESLVYELHQQYTNTGRPELLSLEPSDIEATKESDD